VADTLRASLIDSGRRAEVVADLQTFIDTEVSNKGGLSGGVIKTGYAAVKKIKPGIISQAINGLLPDFTAALEPYWAQYQTAPVPGGFGAYLASRPQEVSAALLAVTDARAERSSRGSVTSVYNRLRPKGQDNVIEALPRLGALVERHAG
jgi:hypothetical protein